MQNGPHFFVSFGTLLKNLEISISNDVLGFKRYSVASRLQQGAKVFLYCKQQIFGFATVEGGVYQNSDQLWSDESYPHRLKITDIRGLSVPFRVGSETIGKELIEGLLGKGWGYKYVSSPRELPSDFVRLLESKLLPIDLLDREHFLNSIKRRIGNTN